MRQTNVQRKATASLRAIAGGCRVQLDAEGWPMIPGRLGRIEHHDNARLAVFTNRRRLHARISAIPGVQRHQTGDEELRALFPPDCLPQVAKTIRGRRKRAVSAASLRNLSPAAGAATRFGLVPFRNLDSTRDGAVITKPVAPS
jgi:hypothetical protein